MSRTEQIKLMETAKDRHDELFTKVLARPEIRAALAKPVERS